MKFMENYTKFTGDTAIISEEENDLKKTWENIFGTFHAISER